MGIGYYPETFFQSVIRGYRYTETILNELKPQKIILSNSDPEAKSLLIPDSAEEGTVVSFSVEAVDLGSGDSHKYLWDFGDGMTSNIQYPDHIYKFF